MLQGVGSLVLAQELDMATANVWPVSSGTINDEDVLPSSSSDGAFSSAYPV